MNRHKYIDADGEHKVGGTVTGFLHSDAVTHGSCPRCGSDPGFHCQSASGRRVWPPHRQRLETGADPEEWTESPEL
jgi:hypothetical protein